MSLRGCGTWAGVLLLFASTASRAQAPDTSVATALRGLEARAGVAFRGQVTAIRRSGDVVEISFRVDEWLKGGAGASYVLREWAGLWAAGAKRYSVGECDVLFLHAAGPGGVASPVDGMDGVLPVVGVAQSADVAVGVSVERLRTRVLRAVGSPMVPAGPLSMDAMRAVLAGVHEPVWRPVPVGVAARKGADETQ